MIIVLYKMDISFPPRFLIILLASGISEYGVVSFHDRFDVVVHLRYYGAMSPADERQPRKISSVHRVRRFVLANVLRVCLRLHAKTVGRCSRRRCKPLMTLYGTWEQAAVLRCLVFSKRVDPCRRCRSSSTTTAMITTFSLQQLQLEWHRKRQVVSCIGSSRAIFDFFLFHLLFRRISRKFMTGYILQYLSLAR